MYFSNFVFLYAVLAVLHQELLWHVVCRPSYVIISYIGDVHFLSGAKNWFICILYFIIIVILFLFIKSLNIAKHIKVIVIILIKK